MATLQDRFNINSQLEHLQVKSTSLVLEFVQLVEDTPFFSLRSGCLHFAQLSTELTCSSRAVFHAPSPFFCFSEITEFLYSNMVVCPCAGQVRGNWAC